MKNFWTTLFPGKEYICLARTKYDTAINSVDRTSQFFCINSLIGPRKDSNVHYFRNILLEFDDGSPGDQLEIITDVPHSTLVWSGGKSHHAIISLEEPCRDRAEYDALVRRIYAKLPMVDKSVKNPSRLSRAPDAMRDNGNKQHLIHVKGRVSRSELDAWLGPELKTEQRTAASEFVSLAVHPTTLRFFAVGVEDNRNTQLFAAACDAFRCGWSYDSILEKAQKVLDLSDKEMRQCIKSAQLAVQRG